MKTDEILYRTSILAFDTTTIKSFSCIEFDDQESCNSIMPGSNDSSSGGNEDGVVGSKNYTDDLLNPIKNGQKAVEAARNIIDKNPTCGGSCYHKCLQMVSEIWQKAGGSIVAVGLNADTGYQHYKSKGWVHDGSDKYNIPIGAVMWSGKDKSGGHAYIYIGEGKIVSTDLNCDSKICVSPAADIEKVWNHIYLGWSDPHQEWGN